jgi:hypothetical protein
MKTDCEGMKPESATAKYAKYANVAAKGCPGGLVRVFRLFGGQDLLLRKVEKTGISPKTADIRFFPLAPAFSRVSGEVGLPVKSVKSVKSILGHYPVGTGCKPIISNHERRRMFYGFYVKITGCGRGRGEMLKAKF